MPPRKIPPTERFVELINEYASQYGRGLDVSRCAVAYGFTTYGRFGFADFVKAKERTLQSTVNGWLRTAACGDNPPFYLLSIRDGYVKVLRAGVDDPDHIEGQNISQLGLCSPDVDEHIGLDESGAFLAPETRRSTPNARPVMHGRWVITPDALRYFVQRAEQARDHMLAEERREKAEREALVDSRHGVDLDYIRALLLSAGLDPERHLDVNPVGERTVAGFRLKDDEITRLASALAKLGLTPVTRAQAVPAHC